MGGRWLGYYAWRSKSGCRFHHSCKTCPYVICLFESHTAESCDVVGVDRRPFLPEVPDGVGVRPLLDSLDLNLIVRAFECYMRYGEATVNGDADRAIDLVARVMCRSVLKVGRAVAWNNKREGYPSYRTTSKRAKGERVYPLRSRFSGKCSECGGSCLPKSGMCKECFKRLYYPIRKKA